MIVACPHATIPALIFFQYCAIAAADDANDADHEDDVFILIIGAVIVGYISLLLAINMFCLTSFCQNVDANNMSPFSKKVNALRLQTHWAMQEFVGQEGQQTPMQQGTSHLVPDVAQDQQQQYQPMPDSAPNIVSVPNQQSPCSLQQFSLSSTPNTTTFVTNYDSCEMAERHKLRPAHLTLRFTRVPGGYRINGIQSNSTHLKDVAEGFVCLDGSNAWWTEDSTRNFPASKFHICCFGRFDFETPAFEGEWFSNIREFHDDDVVKSKGVLATGRYGLKPLDFHGRANEDLDGSRTKKLVVLCDGTHFPRNESECLHCGQPLVYAPIFSRVSFQRRFRSYLYGAHDTLYCRKLVARTELWQRGIMIVGMTLASFLCQYAM